MSYINFVNGQTPLDQDTLNAIQEVVDNLSSSLTNEPLSANQGRVLAGTVKNGSNNATVTFSLSGGTLNINTTNR